MLKLYCMTVGDYQTNCYVIHQVGSAACCIIDPGYEPERILRALEDRKLQPEAILLTHGHFDHVGGVKTIAAETDCQVYISSQELRLPPMLTAGKLYYTGTYPENGLLEAAGISFRVIPTPGHTPGSVCLTTEDVMFSGDTLFAGSCGRTDLPGGSRKQITESLQCLAALEGDYQVFPGHGNSTTLAQEKKYNPYL